VRHGERRIARLELTATADGWAFSVSSRPEGGGAAQAHVTGNARRLPATPEQRHDLAAWAARCDLRVKHVTDDDALDDDHGPRWQCVRKLQWGRGEILAVLELPTEFAGDLTRMKLHPSMLDKAIGTGRELAPADVPYIPYSYRRVVYERPFTRRIHVHTRAKSADSTHGEMPTFNLTITDDDGRQLVTIEEFALKRIHDVRAVYRTIERTPEPPAAAIAEPTTVTSQSMLARVMEQEGITPEEGAEVFSRLLALPRLSQVAISTADMNLVLEHGLYPAARAQLVEQAPLDDAAPPRPALPLRPRPSLTIPFVDPQGELQELLASILRDVLGLETVGARDNFFDLGGDSVLAIQIVSRIRKATGNEVAVVQLFEAPTIEALAQTLGGDRAGSSSEDAATRGARRRARAVARRQGT
jgi:aryl carrier-like protein